MCVSLHACVRSCRCRTTPCRHAFVYTVPAMTAQRNCVTGGSTRSARRDTSACPSPGNETTVALGMRCALSCTSAHQGSASLTNRRQGIVICGRISTSEGRVCAAAARAWRSLWRIRAFMSAGHCTPSLASKAVKKASGSVPSTPSKLAKEVTKTSGHRPLNVRVRCRLS